jgi:hypothetical protein
MSLETRPFGRGGISISVMGFRCGQVGVMTWASPSHSMSM